MHLTQAVTIGDVTKVNHREIPGCDPLPTSNENRMKRVGKGLNERFQPLIGPFLGDPGGSDYNSTEAKM